MKRLVALLLACVMMLGIMSIAAAEAPAAGGELIYGSSTEISGDWAHGAIWTNNAVDNMIRSLFNDYSTVVYDQGGAMVINPTVAESIDSVMNADGTKTFTVKIQEDLVFSDGSPIKAENYVASLLLFAHPSLLELGSKSIAHLTYVGGDSYAKGKTLGFAGVRMIDDYTYSLTVLADKVPYFFDLSYASLSPLSIDMWLGDGYTVHDFGRGAYIRGKMKTEQIKDKVEHARFLSEGRVTSGPYNLVSFDTAAKQAVLEINPNYKGNFQGQKPGVQKLIIVKTEDATQFDALKTGGINLIDSLTGGADVNQALDIENAGGFKTVNFERNGYGKLMFQCDFGPTQFQAVRQAIAHLLNRPEFANTFTEGYGALVHGPYGLAMWMYKDSEEELNERLNTYPYSLDDATKLLVDDGWVLDAQGNPWTSGIRYKEVTEEQAGQYTHNVKAGGKTLMPLIIEWASSEGNAVSELLSTMLAKNPDVTTVGMEIRQSVMTFPELLNYMYRDKTVGDQYGVPTYGMYNLATNFTPAYDMSYSWTSDPDMVASGFNVNFLFNDELDKISMDMVYGVESGDNEAYLKLWVDYIDLWNELLPEIPLYSNVYYTIFVDTLQNFEQSSLWDFENAIIYSSMDK